MSRMIAGGDHEMEGEAGESGTPPDTQTDAERIQQAHDLYHQERLRADQLEEEIQALRKGKKLGRDPL